MRFSQSKLRIPVSTDILRVPYKNRAFKFLMYLASNTTLSKMHVIENIWFQLILQIYCLRMLNQVNLKFNYCKVILAYRYLRLWPEGMSQIKRFYVFREAGNLRNERDWPKGKLQLSNGLRGIYPFCRDRVLGDPSRRLSVTERLPPLSFKVLNILSATSFWFGFLSLMEEILDNASFFLPFYWQTIDIVL